VTFFKIDKITNHPVTYKKFILKEVIKPLLELWRISGYISSKHLVKFIRLNEDKLSNFFDKLNPDVRERLLKINASTLDIKEPHLVLI